MAKPRQEIFQTNKYQAQGTAMYFFKREHRPVYIDSYYAAFKNTVKHYNEYLGDSDDVKEIADIYFSGPVRYGNASSIKPTSVVVSADLVSAYATFLVENAIPGSRRSRFDGYLAPLPGEINVYTFEFAEKNPSTELVEWFLSKESFKFKIQYYGENGIKGKINIMASKDRFDLYELFRKHCPSAKVISTVVCWGKEKVYINRDVLQTHIMLKMQGGKSEKKRLTQSMGNLSHLDKITFYWMVQNVKARVLTQLIKGVPFETVAAMNTDGVLIAFDENDIDGMANYVMSLEGVFDVKVEIGVDVNIIGTQVFQKKGDQHERLY